ncbi:MAG: hypothetical protein ACREFQ_10335, partial [Stellaceae bacterium]
RKTVVRLAPVVFNSLSIGMEFARVPSTPILGGWSQRWTDLKGRCGKASSNARFRTAASLGRMLGQSP